MLKIEYIKYLRKRMGKEIKVKEEEKKVATVEEKVEETKAEVKTIPEKKDKKKKKGGIVLLIIGLFLVILGLVSYILYPYVESFIEELTPTLEEESDIEETEEEDTDEVTAEEDTDETTTDEIVEEDTDEVITGDYVSVTVPEGWTLVEYMDGDGTTMLNSGDAYTGLTGLKIFNPQSENVFSMMAVSGIGFAGCSDYAKFSDESISYYQEQVSNNSQAGITMEEHDYTSTVYAEFDWLGTTMRRITDLYYYDTKEGNNYFEPPCVPGLIVLEGLTFEDSFGYVGEAYFYGLEDIAEVSEYEIVDSILESMETI